MYEIIKLELYKLKKSKMFWGIMIYIIFAALEYRSVFRIDKFQNDVYFTFFYF